MIAYAKEVTMAFAVTHPHRTQRGRRVTTGEVAAGRRVLVRPAGATLAATGAILVGIWGAIAGYIGPYFGYRPVSGTVWDWNAQNGLFHLAPGALAVLAGMLLLSVRPARGGVRRAALAVPAVLLAAAGAWFVVGPVAWPMFGTGPAYAPVLGAGTNLLNQAGSALAPGLALMLAAGMALEAAMMRPPVVTLEDEAPMSAGTDVPGAVPVAGQTIPG